MDEELRVKADDNILDEVIQRVMSVLDGTKCSDEVKIQLQLAVEEIFINISHYAYGAEKGDVMIQMQFTEETGILRLTFRDSGLPYNPLNRDDPDVTLSADKRQIGGLGIYLVKQIMDQVLYDYKNGMNCLCMIKKIS